MEISSINCNTNFGNSGIQKASKHLKKVFQYIGKEHKQGEQLPYYFRETLLKDSFHKLEKYVNHAFNTRGAKITYSPGIPGVFSGGIVAKLGRNGGSVHATLYEKSTPASMIKAIVSTEQLIRTGKLEPVPLDIIY